MPDERCPRCNSLDCEVKHVLTICNECGLRFDPYTTEEHDRRFREAGRRLLEAMGKGRGK